MNGPDEFIQGGLVSAVWSIGPLSASNTLLILSWKPFDTGPPFDKLILWAQSFTK